MALYKKSLFIFRRDLRLDDNSSIAHALAQSKEVIPCFIFDPHQVTKQNNYRSMNAIQFMGASLIDLERQLAKKGGVLSSFWGDPSTIIASLIIHEKIDAVFCNRDYTPFSIKRDDAIKKICIQHGCAFFQDHDLLLHEP